MVDNPLPKPRTPRAAAVSAEGGDVFGAGFERHWRDIVAFVRRKVGAGPPEPEEIAQQAFANYAAMDDPSAVANPRAFLHRTASNLLANHYRRGAVERRHAASEAVDAEISAAGDGFTPETVLLGKEQLALVEEAMRAMEPRRRRYLLMNRLDGLSYAEIARREGVSESGVRKVVAAAVRDCTAALTARDITRGDNGGAA